MLWEISDNMAIEDLRGAALYDALMAIKPDAMSEGEWADKAGLNRGFFSDLKGKDTRPRIDTLQKLKRVAEASLPASKVPDQMPTRSISAGETIEIARVDLSLPMGPGATVDNFVEDEPLTFDLAYVRSFTRTPANCLKIAMGVGDSMFPTLVSADLVWIDTTQNQLLHSDRIYAASINGGAAIKRLRPIAGGQRVLVISDNKTIEPYEVDADDVVIWGRVIRFARDL
jgi:phage repressor protein C with HTH and peptisase S24 domain